MDKIQIGQAIQTFITSKANLSTLNSSIVIALLVLELLLILFNIYSKDKSSDIANTLTPLIFAPVSSILFILANPFIGLAATIAASIMVIYAFLMALRINRIVFYKKTKSLFSETFLSQTMYAIITFFAAIAAEQIGQHAGLAMGLAGAIIFMPIFEIINATRLLIKQSTNELSATTEDYWWTLRGNKNK